LLNTNMYEMKEEVDRTKAEYIRQL
jgi:hypothetical protein